MMANAPVHIKSLLKHFPEIPFNWKGSSQVSPLEFGVPRLKITAATPIINAGALASQTPPSGNVLQELGSTLLPEVWVAMAQTGLSREDIVHSCLELVLGKDPELLNNADEAGFTPLMGASQYHDCTVIQAMLRRGANVQARTSVEYDGRTALNLITTNKAQWPARDCTFELLLEAGADPDMPSRPGGKRLLHFAARDDDVVTAKKLLNLALDASLGPETADEDVARMVNSRTELYGQTPLHIAAQYGSARVVRLLLDHGAETDIGHFRGTFNAWDWDGLTPLAVASCMAQTSVIQLLLDHEHASSLARPVSHHSVLHLAAAEPDGGKMLRMLLNIPAINGSAGLLNGPAKGGVTPLHLCASNMGRVEHARILLDAGADPNTRSKSGHSVLDAALALRSRIASFLAKWEGISESGTQTEFADVLAQEIDLWQPVTQAGGRFSLVLKEKGQKIYIPVEEVIRYRDEFEREDGAENESEGEHTKSDQQSQSTLPPSDESEGDDGPAILDFKDMLTEVDGMVDMIRQGGGTFGTTDPIPENLFAMKI